MEKRLSKIEHWINQTEVREEQESLDWDNATLLRNWNISKRTAANYRKQGLQYFKRGGRVMYSPESREQFINIKKQLVTE